MTPNKKIITLDGPAGVGKTTLARMVAEKLRLPSLDTGAMFRALALDLGEAALTMSEEELRTKNFNFKLDGAGADSRLYFNGQPLGDELRTEKISALASKIATRPEIRNILLQAQRRLGADTSLVAEGRDMGTIVFPNASHKFFLEAAPKTRAIRRWKELLAKGQSPDLAELEESIAQRDRQDRSRSIAPLQPAPDAIIIDTTELDIPAALDQILSFINQSGSCA